MDIVGLPENLKDKGEELEGTVLNVFEVIGVPVEKHSFHAIHRLHNTRVVIAKVCNLRVAITIFCNKKKLCELSQERKKNSRVKKSMLMNLCVLPANVSWVNAMLIIRKIMLMHFA